MKIDEKINKGLKREYKICVSAADIETKTNGLLEDVQQKVNLKGFRPGKAPFSLIKKLHGKRVMGQVLEELVSESTTAAFSEKKIEPATQPNVKVLKFDEGKDLEFEVSVEVMPEVTLPDLAKLKLERLVVNAGDQEIDQALERLASQQKNFESAPKTRAAAMGDAVVIDYLGRIDGEAFEDGTSDGFQLELGSGMFIPGFEDQLVGVKAKDKRDVTVTFPSNYGSSELAGKEAIFEVTVKEVKTARKTKVDDALAKTLGLDDLAALRENISSQLIEEYEQISRNLLKRNLLDTLADNFVFEVPAGMVSIEFNQIWEQLKQEAVQSGESKLEDFEGMDGPDDASERKDYETIAERRVRLGLLLSAIGKANKVEITQEEVNRRLMQEAGRYRGNEKEVFDFYRNNDGAMAQLRAPLYEEKVCEFIFGEANITDKSVSRQDLEQAVKALDENESTAMPQGTKKGADKKTKAKPTDESAANRKPAAKKKSPAKKKAVTKKDA